jgi:hypothetical protein
MTIERREKAEIVYIQAVPGENLHAKPLGTKTWRKPGQVNNYTCRKKIQNANRK